MAENTSSKAASPEGERIAKVLSRRGVASRREAERLIEAGEVTVNGKIITVDADDSVAAALAIRDGRILALGTTAEIEALAGPSTYKLSGERTDTSTTSATPARSRWRSHHTAPLRTDQAGVA